MCGAGVAGLGVLGLAVAHAAAAQESLERARAGLARVQDGSTTVRQAAGELERAGALLTDAERDLHRWPVDVVAAVPVLGRSFDAARAVTQTAGHVVGGATVLAQRLPEVRAGGGGVDVGRLADVRARLDVRATSARAALDDLGEVDVALTPPQVRTGVEQAHDVLAPAVQALEHAHTGLGLVSGLLGGDGPRTFLVMLQNNAELRGAGGYAASFATGRAERGRLTLDPLQDVLAVADPPERARTVPAPEEYLEDFAPLAGNTTVWRSWNMSPDVPDSALVGARIAGVLLGTEPDVVVLLDVPAMAALAALSGDTIALPDGSSVDPDELAQALLVDAYADAGRDREAQDARRFALQAAATSAVGRLLAGEVAPSDAARTLGRLAAERHLSVWSARPDEQRDLVALDLAGAVRTAPGGDLSHVSVNNIGGNKLDVYVDREVEIDVVLGRDAARVVQRVRFTNGAPDGLVPYVAGVDQPGVVVSRVELSLPPTARGVTATVDGAPLGRPPVPGPERTRLFHHLELARGASAVLEARYTIPVDDGSYRLRVIPQALVEDADLRLSVAATAGEGLAARPASPRSDTDEPVPLTRTFERVVELERLPPASRWQRLRQWWHSPVTIDLPGG